jgi:hypothetical protein
VPDLNESVIVTPHVVSLLRDVARYNVLSPQNVDVVNGCEPNVSHLAAIEVMQDDIKRQDVSASDNVEENIETDDFRDIEQPQDVDGDRVADTETLMHEQKSCPPLNKRWELAKKNKGNFFIDNDLLYHHDKILGHKVNQLCLPERRVPIVLEMGHDAPFAGHMTFQATRHRIRLSFWFRKMDELIRSYCSTCTVSQLRAPVKVSDRVPITPIPRNDELPFTNLVMDCIGLILPETDHTAPKPVNNHQRLMRW